MSAQKTKPSGVFGAIAGLLGLSVLAGALVTAMVTPALAVTSLTTQASIGVFNSLPEYLKLESQSQKNTIYALDNNQKSVPIAQIFHQNREEVPWEDINDNVKNALLTAEDRKFYEHGGVNVSSTIRAALGNLASSSIQSGASTLTMQLVKNILIMQALDEPTEAKRNIALADAQAQTIDRKLKEMKLAIGLEKQYTKNEILLGYLNIAGFGGNTYGIQSAAQQFFSVNARDLTLPQAASLIAIVQTPTFHSLNDPDNYEENTKRRDFILTSMATLGYITAAERDEAIATPLEVKLSPPKNGCIYATIGNFFCDFVERQIPELESLGATPEERQANWERGGYQIHTTLDYSQQQNANARVLTEAPANEKRFKLGAAASVVEPGTGRILAMAQNKTYNNSAEGGGPTATAVNYNTSKKYGGSSGFQSGSTYKIFTLVEWLKQNHGLNETVDGRVKTYDQADFTASCADFGGPWKVPNYGNAGGSVATSVMRATTASINSAYAAMAFKLDLCKIRDTALSMGVERADGTELQPNPASILGTNDISPLSMADAVATITSGGKHCKPIAIDRIVNAAGEELPGQEQDCEQVMTPEVAAAAAYALRAVVTGGTAAGANPGGNVIGKTGTTDAAVQTWLVGGTTEAALAVWVGNIVGHANLGHYGLPNGNGNFARHRIFQNIMGYLNGEYGGGKAFPSPPARLLAGVLVAVPDVSGQTKEAAAALLASLGFVAQNGGVQPNGMGAGKIIYTTPRAGSKVSQGSVVYYYPSDGSLTETMPDVIGQDRDAAKAALVGAGFDASKISVSYVDNPDPLASCKVASTTPAPGAATSFAAAITLKVNRDESLPPGPCS